MRQENLKIWYLFEDGCVRGPFTAVEVKTQAQSGLPGRVLIWRKGDSEWHSLGSWLARESDLDDVWYVSVEGFHSGPYTLQQIAEEIRHKRMSINLQLWTQGLKKWVKLYDIPELVLQAGLPRRKHPRAPLVGDVHINNFLARRNMTPLSLSVGGIALKTQQKMELGAKLKLKIESDLLKCPIVVKARVVYQHGEQVGLEFLDLSPKHQEAVQEYVKQYEAAMDLTELAAA